MHKISPFARLSPALLLAFAVATLTGLFPASALGQFNLSNKPRITTAGPSAVVLDFSVAPRVSEHRDCCTRRISYTEKEVVTEKDSRGWWLGRQDIYVNANVGRMAADLITDALRTDCVYQVRSRSDLKYYYADKKDLIRKKFSQMSEKEINKAVLLLDPVAIGRELGVQKVVVGHICDSELRKAVAPGSFASVASLTVAVFDVATGRIEFEKCYRKIRNHSTQYFHFEKIAEEVSRDIAMHRAGADYAAQYQPR